MRRPEVAVLFFISGMSALMCEVVWQRLLTLVFGVSTWSVSAVLAAFMLGLAVGALACGSLADRTSRPLRGYAWLQASLGAVGLLVPWAFAGLTHFYGFLQPSWQLGQGGGTALRFGMALAVLVVPCTLMGGTLPLMGRLAAGQAKGGSTAFSLSYAINTLGAVAGAALTGFALLPHVGMQQTLALAALLNFLVAIGAALGSRRELVVVQAVPAPQAHDGGLRHPPRRLALGCAAMTGATTLALEITWSRVLGILTSNSAYGFALVLTVLLLGLGLGSLLQAGWSRWSADPWRQLAVCQWLLAGVLLLSLPFLTRTPHWLEHWCDGQSVTAVFLGEFLLTASILFVPALLLGTSLPLLVAAVRSDERSLGRQVGRLSAVNTLGSVAGAVLAGGLFIPILGIQSTFGLLIGGCLLVGVVAWHCAAAPRWAAVLVILTAALAWSFLPPGRYLKSAVTEPRHLLYYREGNNATVSVVEEGDGLRSILVDGQPVAGTSSTNRVDQKMLAHLPLLLHPRPRHALTVGFGSGGTSQSMARHGIRVDCVEIEAAVPAAAGCFGPENQAILTEPRFRLILDDARSWLRVAPYPYEVMVTDCTNLQYRSNGDLYTVEYFQLMKARLTEDGLAAAWVPANGIADRDLRTLLRTFRQVFPHTSVWYMNARPTDFLIVVGTPGPLVIDWPSLCRRMSVPEIAHDLASVGLADPARLLYTFLAADEDLARYLDVGPLNTDDRPILSYSTYGATFRSTIAENLLRLLACRSDVARFVRNAGPRESLLRQYAASNAVLLGHLAHLNGSEPAALAHYRQGMRFLPDDPALQELVHTAAWSADTMGR